ncbi:MAG: DUF6512 family protein [Candidatus Atribacteria bacterium]|nr:DUF6512 family protein [Candidatus Atribacteria bacterium]
MISTEYKRLILIWEISCTLFVIFFGSMLHFIYGWTNHLSVIGLFAPVNESVWEHLKLGFWSLTIFSIPEYFLIGKKVKNFFIAKLAGVFALEIVIVVIFYIYTSILGKDLLAMDIGSYVAGAIVCQIIAMQIFIKTKQSNQGNAFAIAGIVAIALIFMLFTYITPRIPIFKDKNTGEYGAKWGIETMQ